MSVPPWDCGFGYRPDRRVARAWGFCVNDPVIDSQTEGIFSVALPRWLGDLGQSMDRITSLYIFFYP